MVYHQKYSWLTIMYQYHHAWYLNCYLARPLLGLSQMSGDDTQKQVEALFIRLTGH